ncbi:MAG: ATP-dependent DNA helicase [Bacilli bacterium]|nr:ATP-dependent DNA helicase [Bacilli bacterium]
MKIERKAHIELSVHQLVDFLLRSGDIDNRVFNRSSQTEGSRLHSVYQSSQGKNYISEYPLKKQFLVDNIEIVLQGRADGIIKKSEKEYIIDEIKTTVIELEEFREENLEWHLGQAKCYAYMFADALKLDSIGVRLTYIKQGKNSKKLIDEYYYQFFELEKDIYDYLDRYLEFYNVIMRLNEQRNASIEQLSFPFKSYRKGQKSFSKAVYEAAQNKGKIFIEAPTGIGKTMSAIYPYVKYLKQDELSKIFYLTAKATGKENAHKALNILKDNGLNISDIIITSKEKICFCKGQSCNPDECPFAKGYYNKIKDILKESIMRYDDFDYETIRHIANKNGICPFELELDLSLFCDVIICDYNYVFDPISYMKRYFDEDASHYLVLVDEAHNLVDRSKDMYSASVDKKLFLKAKKSLKGVPNRKIKNALARINKVFEYYEDTFEIGTTKVDDFSIEAYKEFNHFVTVYQEVSKEDNKVINKDLTDLYIEINKFIKIAELISDHFLIYVNKVEDNITFKIYCLDASRFLSSTCSRVNSTALFSATLSPIEYYVNVLGGDINKNQSMILESPFPKENLKLIIAPKISTRYKNRDKSYADVAKYIKTFVSNKVGNYFVYLPSYEYLDNILPLLEFDENVDVFIQKKDMTEQDKQDFISNFHQFNERSKVGLAIIGGAFGEGIDLVGDSLIGVAIIGIGLPKINFESNNVAEYYKNNNVDGFNYAYTYPGMNKVMQAVGRLIRTESDRGAALLIDERYMWNDYKSLFKKEWSDYEVVLSIDELKETLQNFFKS